MPCLLSGSTSHWEPALRPLWRKGVTEPLLLCASPLLPIYRRIVQDHLPSPAAADIWSLPDLRHSGTTGLGLAWPWLTFIPALLLREQESPKHPNNSFLPSHPK